MTTDKNIKRFQLEILVKDMGVLAQKFDLFQGLMEDQMRDAGYVPMLDLGTHVASLYNQTRDEFNVKLTSHAIYVGKRKACTIQGQAGTKLIPLPIHPPKSEQSSDN